VRVLRLDGRWLTAVVLTLIAVTAFAEPPPKRIAIAEFGEPLFGETLTHWPYVNPKAPRGGSIVVAAFGTFDNLNQYILKGNVARSIGVTNDSLMTGSGDDLLGMYALIAKNVSYPDDISEATFELHQEAHYDDGTAITADDFKLAFDTIRTHGRPFLRSFYREVDSVAVIDAHHVKFTFKTRNNMKPLMAVAGLSPLPSHYWKSRDITATTLKPQPSSGAYKVAAVDPGRSITYERVSDYWGEGLPVNVGQNNIQTIRYDYYRDFGVMFEAFKAGDLDFRSESSSKRWATEYDFPAIKDGRVLRAEPRSERPEGMQGLVLNTRRAKFSDSRVREALAMLFDFEWTQKALLYGQYTRTESYFPNSDYGSSGPLAEDEKAILEPYRSQLPETVFENGFKVSRTDGSGRIRRELRRALKLLKVAGWSLKEGKLRDSKGQQMTVEILLVQPDFERLLSPYIDNLKRAGIAASMRIVDTSQYENRTNDFDFDMVNVKFNFFPPPGPELRSYYGSKASTKIGSANWPGIRSPVVDELVEKIISAEDLETLKRHTRALDRVLLSGHYMIPQWYNAVYRIAYWDRFGRPERAPRFDLGFPGTWWIDAKRDAALSR
jgi:microcin C transport system substrate-binding protein